MEDALQRPTRLASIEILRGAAALAVVAYHATRGNLFLSEAATSPWLLPLAVPASLGFSGVFLFFVISGFCIHLARARQEAQTGIANTDFMSFWRRRIRRLYPPYLVALIFFVFLQWAEGAPFSQARSFGWDMGLHLLMLHNLDPATALTINGVFWTLAIEEQLYLAYFLLLGLKARVGWFWTLAICLAARVGWFLLAFAAHRLFGIAIVVQESAAAHWFVWALGAWSVEAWFGLVARPWWVCSRWLSRACLLGAAGLSLSSRLVPPEGALHDWIWLVNDPLWGFGFFVLVNRWTAAESAPGRPLQWLGLGTSIPTALRKVGLFSYSLYLTHELVLTHLAHALSPLLPEHESTSVLIRVFLLGPLAVAVAWLFFLAFERPFLASRGSRDRR